MLFAVSDQGMRELQADREPWMLVKELIQNAWDESPCATQCEVTVTVGDYNTQVVVTDDGPGFAYLPDAWTLMGATPKRANPLKRGRFNMGDKEIIAAASKAIIETVGHTVAFLPMEGRRTVDPNNRTQGTIVTVTMPWNQEQADKLVERLRRFRPTDCSLIVNKIAVPKREPIATGRPTLPTVVQSKPGEPVRKTSRKTEIHLLPPAYPGEAWLYEMGIPVQQINTPYDVDVQQKIPMPPQRDTVSDSYLRDIYTETLNSTHHLLKKDEFHGEWVKQALSNRRTVTSAAVENVKRGRYGEKALLMSDNTDANLHAIESGYQLIDPHSLSKREHNRIRTTGTETTTEAFSHTSAPRNAPYEVPEETENHTRFKAWIKSLAGDCGLNAEVMIIEAPKAATIADCTASTNNPTLRFNQSRLGEQFFAPPYGRADQLELAFHELGHARQSERGHGPSWGEAVATVAGLVASQMVKGKISESD